MRLSNERTDRLEACFTEGGVADLPVGGCIGGVQAYRYAIHQAGQLGKDVAAMHDVRLAVGVDTDGIPATLQLGGHLLDQVKPDEWFTVAAEDNLVNSLRLAYGCHDLFVGRFTVQQQVVPLDREIIELSTETAAVGAAVGDIQIQ